MNARQRMIEALRFAVTTMAEQCEQGGDTRKLRAAIEKCTQALDVVDHDKAIKQAQRLVRQIEQCNARR